LCMGVVVVYGGVFSYSEQMYMYMFFFIIFFLSQNQHKSPSRGKFDLLPDKVIVYNIALGI